MTPSERAEGTRIVTAIARIRQKIEYLTTKHEADPDSKAARWAGQDITAFETAISALEYTQQMRKYESMQGSL